MNPILPLAVFVVSSLTGISLTLSLSFFREKTLVTSIGIVIGLTLTTVITYLSTALFLLTPALVSSILLLQVAYITINNVRHKTFRTYYNLTLHKPSLLVITILLILSALISPKLLFSNSSTDGGLATSTINAYGDLGFHLANITNLAYSSTIPPVNPILAGTKLTYPFFSNFFSAILLISGAAYSQAVVWPAFLLVPLTLFLFYHLTFKLTGSAPIAIIALLLFALGGSTLGWIRIFSDLSAPHESIWQLLANLPRNYSGHSDDPLGLYLINPIVSLLLPQRAFMFGMSLSFTILILLNHLTHSQPNRLALLWAGLIAGVLPLFHAHSVLALVPAIILLFFYRPHRSWYIFFLTAAISGLPGILYFITSPSSASASPHLQLGWMAHNQSFIIFWLKNSGLLLPIALLGFFLPATKPTKLLAGAGLLLFLVANIWRFAAWEWDNTKIFVYWLLFTLPLVASATIALWHKSKLYFRSIILALVIFHLLSGSIDIFRLTLPNLPSWPEWDRAAIAMAASIRTHTARNDVILIAPYHNSPAALSGRPVYLGFPGHVWTHGGDHTAREESIRLYYSGQQTTLPQIQPQYLVVGPVERAFYPQLTIQPNWQLISQHQEYSLYQIH